MKRIKEARLEYFKLELKPSFRHGITEIRWEIRTNLEPKIYSEIQILDEDHFVSMIDYVTEKSYRSLRDFLGLKT